ncbi:aminotransferase class III-fold pyridoxal phosphate-dependent enzyme, partial [Cobetia sp.]|uniref:aminotransferase class III-fold pyridoxal phosphate-dependent enzyme n=1 Tax=Cobetia sp. TaxID=1873876 RepID=UPI00257F5A4D
EPVQGEGGIRPLPDTCMKGLRDLCDEHGILLILDEVQCGVGRTGKLFAHEWAGITPDIMMVAKGIGGGFPLGAVLATEDAASGMTAGTHGSTYGGNPLACAVGLAALETIDTPETLDGVAHRHQLLRNGLEGIAKRHGVFKEVRGIGLLIGAQMAPDYAGRAKDILNLAMEEGLMVLIAGPDVLRLAPSLVISEEEIQSGLDKLDRAVANFVAASASA